MNGTFASVMALVSIGALAFGGAFAFVVIVLMSFILFSVSIIIQKQKNNDDS